MAHNGSGPDKDLKKKHNIFHMGIGDMHIDRNKNYKM